MADFSKIVTLFGGGDNIVKNLLGQGMGTYSGGVSLLAGQATAKIRGGEEPGLCDVWLPAAQKFDGYRPMPKGLGETLDLWIDGRERGGAVPDSLVDIWRSGTAAEDEILKDLLATIQLADFTIEGADRSPTSVELIEAFQLSAMAAPFAILGSLEQLLSVRIEMALGVLGLGPAPIVPALRLFDLVGGLPHSHPHPPFVPLPSVGFLIPLPLLSGAETVLINGMNAARCGDIGVAVGCCGLMPFFEVFLGSSSVYVQGNRAGRMLFDVTMHCILSSAAKLIQAKDKPIGPPLGLTFTGSTNVFIGGFPLPSLTGLLFSGLFGLAAKEFAGKFVGNAAEAVKEGAAGVANKVVRPSATASAKQLAAMSDEMNRVASRGASAAGQEALKDLVNQVLRGAGGGKASARAGVRSGAKSPLVTALRRDKASRMFNRNTIKAGARAGKYSKKSHRMVKWSLGDPVDLVTGEVLLDQLDFELAWRVPLVWSRSYRSDNRRRGVCGLGWDTPGDARLQLEPDGLVLFFRGDGDGAAIFGRVPKPGESLIELAAGAELCCDAAGTLSVVGQDGLVYHFAPLDRTGEAPVVRITGPGGASLGFGRTKGRLHTITNEWGGQVRFQRRERHGTRVVLAGGQGGADDVLVRYRFDGDGRLLAAADPLGHAVRFVYGGLADRMVAHTDRNGATFRYEHDEQGRVVRTEGDHGLLGYSLVHDPDAMVTSVTDSTGGVSRYRYNRNGVVVELTDALGGVSRYTYDGRCRAISRVDRAGTTNRKTLDRRGNLTASRRPDDLGETYEFDERGLMVRHIGPNGAERTWTHDARGMVCRSTTAEGEPYQFDHDDRGDLVGIVDPLGQVTRLVHRRQGGLRRVILPDGSATELEHDRRGALSAVRGPDGRTARIRSDGAGRPAAVEYPDGTSEVVQRDAEGRVVQWRGPTGDVVTVRRAVRGGVERLVGPWGSQGWVHDAEERLVGWRGDVGGVELERDALGRVTGVFDDTGQGFDLALDRGGRVVALEDPEGGRTRLSRDAMGRLTSWTDADGGWARLTWDAEGRLLDLERGQGDDPEQATRCITQQYDLDGNLVRQTSAGRALLWQYDPNGRCVWRGTSGGARLEYERDELGRVGRLDVDGGTVWRGERDARGLPVREQYGHGLVRTTRRDARGRAVEREFVHRGRKVLVRPVVEPHLSPTPALITCGQDPLQIARQLGSVDDLEPSIPAGLYGLEEVAFSNDNSCLREIVPVDDHLPPVAVLLRNGGRWVLDCDWSGLQAVVDLGGELVWKPGIEPSADVRLLRRRVDRICALLAPRPSLEPSPRRLPPQQALEFLESLLKRSGYPGTPPQ